MKNVCAIGILSMLILLAASPSAAGELPGSAKVTTNLTKNGVRVELSADLAFGYPRQNEEVWKVCRALYAEFLRNGWRNDGSGEHVGAVRLEHEERMRGGVVKVNVRGREG